MIASPSAVERWLLCALLRAQGPKAAEQARDLRAGRVGFHGGPQGGAAQGGHEFHPVGSAPRRLVQHYRL